MVLYTLTLQQQHYTRLINVVTPSPGHISDLSDNTKTSPTMAVPKNKILKQQETCKHNANCQLHKKLDSNKTATYGKCLPYFIKVSLSLNLHGDSITNTRWDIYFEIALQLCSTTASTTLTIISYYFAITTTF